MSISNNCIIIIITITNYHSHKQIYLEARTTGEHHKIHNPNPRVNSELSYGLMNEGLIDDSRWIVISNMSLHRFEKFTGMAISTNSNLGQ